MFYDLDTNTNSSSNELKSHMEDFILIIIMLQQSDEGFGSGKKHVLDHCKYKSPRLLNLGLISLKLGGALKGTFR